MFFRVRFDRTELIKIIQMHQIHHVKSFKCNKTEFGSIEPNSKKYRNIEKIRFGSIEIIRLFQESSRVSLY
jgi:hypothetical protein